jgi:hypothetical protein
VEPMANVLKIKVECKILVGKVLQKEITVKSYT